jgi:hypothetical protein
MTIFVHVYYSYYYNNWLFRCRNTLRYTGKTLSPLTGHLFIPAGETLPVLLLLPGVILPTIGIVVPVRGSLYRSSYKDLSESGIHKLFEDEFF